MNDVTQFFKYLSDEELKELSFWELAIYMEQLNNIEKVYNSSKQQNNGTTLPVVYIDKESGLSE